MKINRAVSIVLLIQILIVGFLSGQDYDIYMEGTHLQKLSNIAFDASRSEMMTLERGEEPHVKIWNEYFQVIHSFPLNNKNARQIHISPDGKYTVILFGKNEIQIWDNKERQIIGSLESHLSIQRMCFSPDGKELAFTGRWISPGYQGGFNTDYPQYRKTNLNILDFSTIETRGEIVQSSRPYNKALYDFIDYSGQYFLGTYFKDGKPMIDVWDNKINKKVKVLPLQDIRITVFASFIPGTSNLVYGGHSSYYVLNFLTGELVSTIEKTVPASYFVKPINNGYLHFAKDSSHVIMDRKTKQIIWKNKNPARLSFEKFHPSKPLAFLGLGNGQVEVWNYLTNTKLFNMMSTKTPIGYILLQDSEYYMGTKEDVRNLIGKKETENVNFEQFDIERNRPDLILNRIPGVSQNTVAEYKELYDTRRALMGDKKLSAINNEEAPVIQIINKTTLPDENTIVSQNGQIDLRIKMKDAKLPLTQLDVFVNKMPVFGKGGKKIKSSKVLISTIPIQLSNGENLIEVRVKNIKGVSSTMDAVSLNYSKKDFKQKIHFIGVGISKYQNEAMNLAFADKDVKDVANYLKTNASTYAMVSTKTYVNEQANKANILSIKEELKKTDIDDIVILYLAGHGDFNENQEWNFLPYDYQKGKLGITDNMINDIVSESKSRKIIIIIDACHSGESIVGRTFNTIVLDESGKSRGVVEDGVEEDEESNLSKLTVYELKKVFNDLRNETGTVVIAASSARGYAIEGLGYQNGVFTYCFLNALNTIIADSNFDQYISISELMTYVHDEVISITNGQQQPNFKRKNAGHNFDFWYRERKKVDYGKLFD